MTSLSPYFHPVAEVDCYLSTSPLEVAELLKQCQHPACGGIVLFSGDVRNFNNEKPVHFIDYEVYEPLAQKLIREILLDAIAKWNLGTALAVHRTGRVAVGETAVVVVTAHRHRKEAYEANEYIIYRIKHEVPIWKREVYEGGSFEWGTNGSMR